MKNDLSADQLAQEITVSLPLGVVLRLADPAKAVEVKARLHDLKEKRCAVGEHGLYGIYAGVARAVNGEPDAIIEVLAEAPEKLSWDDAMKWGRVDRRPAADTQGAGAALRERARAVPGGLVLVQRAARVRRELRLVPGFLRRLPGQHRQGRPLSCARGPQNQLLVLHSFSHFHRENPHGQRNTSSP